MELESEIAYLKRFLTESRHGHYTVNDLKEHIDPESFLNLFKDYEDYSKDNLNKEILLFSEKVNDEIARLDKKKKSLDRELFEVPIIGKIFGKTFGKIIAKSVEKGCRSVDVNATTEELERQEIKDRIKLVASTIPSIIIPGIGILFKAYCDPTIGIKYWLGSCAYAIADMVTYVPYLASRISMRANLQAERKTNEIADKIGDYKVGIEY